MLAPAGVSPIAMFLGAHDEEVSPTFCQQMADRSRQAGTAIDVTVYPGATHDFDDPNARRQSVPSNRSALGDVLAKALATVERWKK